MDRQGRHGIFLTIALRVEGKFHQVFVSPDDCDALKILWFNNDDLSKPPTNYRMLVHLLGATLSPNGGDNELHSSPKTIITVRCNFYADDILKSVRLGLG